MEDYQGLFSPSFNIPDIDHLLNGLSSFDQEWLAHRLFGAMTADSKSKVINKALSDSGMVVTLDSCSALCNHIKSASYLDIAMILEAIAQRG